IAIQGCNVRKVRTRIDRRSAKTEALRNMLDAAPDLKASVTWPGAPRDREIRDRKIGDVRGAADAAHEESRVSFAMGFDRKHVAQATAICGRAGKRAVLVADISPIAPYEADLGRIGLKTRRKQVGAGI